MPSSKTPTRPSARKVYLRLLHQARPTTGEISAILAMTLLGALVTVALPWPLQFLVDHVLGNKPTAPAAGRMLGALGPLSREWLVLMLAGGSLLLHLLNGALHGMKARLEVAAGQRSANALRARLFDHYQHLSLRDHYRQPLGDQLYRINNDTYCINNLIFAGVLPMVGSALTLSAMFFVLWRLDHWLALLALAVAPFLVACARYYMGPLELESDRVCQRESEVLGLADRVLSALPIVKAFVREDDESRRFREQSGRALGARLRLTNQELWFDFVVGGITAAGTAMILAVGGRHVLRGTLTVGQLLVVIAYLASVYDPLHAISSTLGHLQSAIAGARRVLEVLHTPTEALERRDINALPRVRGHIVFEQVTFGYTPETLVLNGVSFEAPTGSAIALVGPTGAGKTTIASLLLRFYDPQLGRVFIDGVDLRTVSVASLRRQISVVLQEPILFPISLADNIRYGRPDATDEEIRAAAAAAHIDEFIRTLPAGYDTLIAEGGASLSGGERQRIALARAFLKDAPILILDEPTSALDSSTEAKILESLDRLMRGRTSLIIAHRLSTIRRADKILFLEDGRIVEHGTHRQLLAQDGSYAQLHRLYVRTLGTEGGEGEAAHSSCGIISPFSTRDRQIPIPYEAPPLPKDSL
ncbi:MAG: ABC transporter ATP-binding protein [Acidobacteria bacterium]|nr:ABC transporter ATP-binding protein [Acidobacteriota bacterium]